MSTGLRISDTYAIKDGLAKWEGFTDRDPDISKPYPKCLIGTLPRVEYVHAIRSFRVRSEAFRGDVPVRTLHTLSEWEGFLRKCSARADQQGRDVIDQIEESLWHNGYDVTFREFVSAMKGGEHD